MTNLENLDSQIKTMLADNEEVIWFGNPQKKCHVLGAILKMLPIAIIWALVDGFMIGAMVRMGTFNEVSYLKFILIPFFLVHLTPVWLWIAGIIKAYAGYKKITYCITNQRIIIKQGIISSDLRSILLSEVDSLNLRAGILDKICKTGDVYVVGKTLSITFNDVINPEEVYKKLNDTLSVAKNG